MSECSAIIQRSDDSGIISAVSRKVPRLKIDHRTRFPLTALEDLSDAVVIAHEHQHLGKLEITHLSSVRFCGHEPAFGGGEVLGREFPSKILPPYGDLSFNLPSFR